MTFKIFCSALLLSGFSAFADGGTQSTTPANADLSDKEIAKVLLTINDGEIQLGKLAADKTRNPTVKAFAKQMVSAHEANVKDTKALAKKMKVAPVSSDLSVLFLEDAKLANANLRNATKDDFDKAYVDGQITMHESVLDSINNKLIPSAENADLKAHLEKTASAVSEHLEHAKGLRANL